MTLEAEAVCNVEEACSASRWNTQAIKNVQETSIASTDFVKASTPLFYPGYVFAPHAAIRIGPNSRRIDAPPERSGKAPEVAGTIITRLPFIA
ncbi:hypothetical protein M3I54_16875 [Paraburkholderia sp. CNPSo 3274]|uniref:hypothetical protein n=1 Tax=Paraburkholderia sp. CNPSo 3274 TaxID=2940932 RepID=UPI0020B77468|nr:hypothetical protein [Paraburkholderia sp. CNPSo 3274]MCP3708647.1 hypothetical protein [Paraburkholderia sp. CNPSo 3274]